MFFCDENFFESNSTILPFTGVLYVIFNKNAFGPSWYTLKIISPAYSKALM